MEVLAEREGFEPPVPCETPVFKTGAINQARPSLLKADYDIIHYGHCVVKRFSQLKKCRCRNGSVLTAVGVGEGKQKRLGGSSL